MTDRGYWDAYWTSYRPLAVISRSRRMSASECAILDVLESHLPTRAGMSALEIGGAPGRYLAWLSERFGYGCSALDYSAVGCEKTRRNFDALGIPLALFEGDLFAEETESIGSFDVVYSLGLIEHFADFGEAIRRHAALTKPGGWVIVGCPNMLGVNRLLMRVLRPRALTIHNPEAMKVGAWREPAREAGLETVFAGYVGGFDPRRFSAPERGGLGRVVGIAMRIAARLMAPMRPLRHLNSHLWSGYAIAVYRKA